jgi:hypothetical protein
MIQWLRRFLYESTAAEFRSAYSIAESVERLRAATKRSAFSAIGETAAVGKVSPDNVRLQRIIPMVHNSFKPFFMGRFEVRNGETVLTGHFGMTTFVKVFMTFWLGMVALFAAGFLLASFSSTALYPQVVVIGPLLMLAAGLGLVALGKWFGRNDAAWLSGVIAQALDVPRVGAETRQETTIDVAAVPMVLKGVALFLAASGVMVLFMDFFGPRVLSAQVVGPPSVAPWWGNWHKVYAVSVILLAAGVWRRRPWAWWGGFLMLGMSTITSLLAMPMSTPGVPPFMRAVFGAFAVVVVGVWGRWWYAQRKHFLWTAAPTV